MRYNVRVRLNKDFIDVDERQKIIAVGIKAMPMKGKANEELIKKLADHFGVPSSSVLIVSGMRSKDKVVEILKP
jgi:uncharacterized protein